jgi:putative SOS response-associated peptidase YedK
VKRSAHDRRWGLIPSWADDAKIGYRMINARSETVAEKPAFRAAFRQRRCLIPADGFYEWKKKERGATASRQPYHIGLEGGGVFGMAGLWESWIGPDGELVESCTVLTTNANERIAFLHERMPVILGREHWDHWLDPSAVEPKGLLALLAPFPSDAMALRPVSPRVNNGRVDDAACLALYEPPRLPEQGSLF